MAGNESSSSPFLGPLYLYWMRRDIRSHDNTALSAALESAARNGGRVLAVFCFDHVILSGLLPDDRRVSFISSALARFAGSLSTGDAVFTFYGKPVEILEGLCQLYAPAGVFVNEDYEPDARSRDHEVRQMLLLRGIEMLSFKDHVYSRPGEILKADGTTYSVFTAYANRWRDRLQIAPLSCLEPPDESLLVSTADPQMAALRELRERLGQRYQKKLDFLNPVLTPEQIGFTVFSDDSVWTIPPDRVKIKKIIQRYAETRDLPYQEVGTTRLGVHLRFGTVSIREILDLAYDSNVFLNELIWRDFFQMILWYYPDVVHSEFKPEFRNLPWKRLPEANLEFEAWCDGRTGYPLVDAGMRELRLTGFMHNRVRMLVASFLCKHLQIDWRLGERYFARHLLDFELASNNGNWQWAAGTGCDAAPYFRIFNPALQQKKFDPDLKYIRRWLPEYGSSDYPPAIIDHKTARAAALDFYRSRYLTDQ